MLKTFIIFIACQNIDGKPRNELNISFRNRFHFYRVAQNFSLKLKLTF